MFPGIDIKIIKLEIEKKNAKGFLYSRDMDTSIPASMTSLFFKGLEIPKSSLKPPSGEGGQGKRYFSKVK